MDREILADAGKVSAEMAKKYAESEWEKISSYIKVIVSKSQPFSRIIPKMADFFVENQMKNGIFATNTVKLWHTIA